MERHLHDALAAAELWGRGKAQDGTTRFSRVATASLGLNGLRVTVALPFVVPAADTVRGVDLVLSRGKALGIEVACLWRDKGFDGMAVRASRTRGTPNRR